MSEEEKKKRKEMIKYRMKQSQDTIEYHRKQIIELKRELSFMQGHYDKTWEEEYAKDSESETNSPKMARSEKSGMSPLQGEGLGATPNESISKESKIADEMNKDYLLTKKEVTEK